LEEEKREEEKREEARLSVGSPLHSHEYSIRVEAK